jgi:hypothetical protein
LLRIWSENCPLNYDLKKTLSQVSLTVERFSEWGPRDRSRKQTSDDPDEMGVVGLGALCTLSPCRYVTRK